MSRLYDVKFGKYKHYKVNFMRNEIAEVDGKKVKRFEYIGEKVED